MHYTASRIVLVGLEGKEEDIIIEDGQNGQEQEFMSRDVFLMEVNHLL